MQCQVALLLPSLPTVCLHSACMTRSRHCCGEMTGVSLQSSPVAQPEPEVGLPVRQIEGTRPGPARCCRSDQQLLGLVDVIPVEGDPSNTGASTKHSQ